MTRAGMAASYCPISPNDKHMMRVRERGYFWLIMQCSHCGFTSHWR